MTEETKLGGHRGMGCTDHDKYQNIRDIKKLPVENTTESIKMAFKNGAAYVEIDVVMSGDGELFVLHNVVPKDHFFGDDMPQQNLNTMNFSDFASVETGRRFDDRAIKGNVMRFDEMLEIIASSSPKTLPWDVNIEIKGVQGSKQNYEDNDFLDKVAEAVRKSPLDPRRVLFSSFSEQNIVRMSHLVPEAQYGMLYAEAMEENKNNDAIYADHQDDFRYQYQQFDATSVERVLNEWQENAKTGVELKYMHPEILTVDEAMLDLMKQKSLGMNCWALFEECDDTRGALYKDVAGQARDRNVPFTIITDYLPEMKKLGL